MRSARDPVRERFQLSGRPRLAGNDGTGASRRSRQSPDAGSWRSRACQRRLCGEGDHTGRAPDLKEGDEVTICYRYEGNEKLLWTTDSPRRLRASLATRRSISATNSSSIRPSRIPVPSTTSAPRGSASFWSTGDARRRTPMLHARVHALTYRIGQEERPRSGDVVGRVDDVGAKAYDGASLLIQRLRIG